MRTPSLKEIVVLTGDSVLLASDTLTIRVRLTDGSRWYAEEVSVSNIRNSSPAELATFFDELAAACRAHAGNERPT